MEKTSMFTRLAIAGIAAGLVSAAPAHADKGTKKAEGTRTEKSGCKSVKAKHDAHGKKVAADSTEAKAKCRGLNECKGQGGCAMSDKQIEKRAKELGVPREQAGKAHSCKGKNECKGLGGCNM